ncbi:MAG: hypothetical protein Q8S73_36890 [Deltaproteobacteria bacterium]|nr:hypothetical protein [Myxococcales bacterium]MDP3219737.1 hypothetical protein [Deltaproteobacteria bacterium]
MSRSSRQQLGTVVALAALATAPPAGAEGELPPLPEGAPPESIDAAAEFVESDVVAENRQLREENQRLSAELNFERGRLEELRADHQRLLSEQRQSFGAAWEAREREIAAQLQAPRAASPDRPRRAVFDASVPALDADGARHTFAPGDPVPDHIDPATLPEGAVRYLPEEG